MEFERHANESNGAAELRRWDTPRRLGGMRPDGYEEYPKMLYKARKPASGGPYLVIDPTNEQWSEGNCRTVRDQREEERALDDSWRRSPAEAIELCLAREKEISDAAAERHYSERSMSESARREAAAVDAASFEHVAEIKEAPKRGGRKPAA